MKTALLAAFAAAALATSPAAASAEREDIEGCARSPAYSPESAGWPKFWLCVDTIVSNRACEAALGPQPRLDEPWSRWEPYLECVGRVREAREKQRATAAPKETAEGAPRPSRPPARLRLL